MPISLLAIVTRLK